MTPSRRWAGILGLLAGCATAVPDTRPPAVVEVPIQVINNITFVAATINGGPTALLVVDTGAQVTILTPGLLRRLGVALPDDAPRRKIRVVGGHPLDVPFVRIATIRVGGATLNDREVGVYDVDPDTPIVEGLLGGDFLHGFKVTLDRSQKRMRLEPLTR